MWIDWNAIKVISMYGSGFALRAPWKLLRQFNNCQNVRAHVTDINRKFELYFSSNHVRPRRRQIDASEWYDCALLLVRTLFVLLGPMSTFFLLAFELVLPTIQLAISANIWFIGRKTRPPVSHAVYFVPINRPCRLIYALVCDCKCVVAAGESQFFDACAVGGHRLMPIGPI